MDKYYLKNLIQTYTKIYHIFYSVKDDFETFIFKEYLKSLIFNPELSPIKKEISELLECLRSYSTPCNEFVDKILDRILEVISFENRMYKTRRGSFGETR